jgi:hypothetical protein
MAAQATLERVDVKVSGEVGGDRRSNRSDHGARVCARPARFVNVSASPDVTRATDLVPTAR